MNEVNLNLSKEIVANIKAGYIVKADGLVRDLVCQMELPAGTSFMAELNAISDYVQNHTGARFVLTFGSDKVKSHWFCY